MPAVCLTAARGSCGASQVKVCEPKAIDVTCSLESCCRSNPGRGKLGWLCPVSANGIWFRLDWTVVRGYFGTP
eukprot:7383322-Prymnesium_polylepis.1